MPSTIRLATPCDLPALVLATRQRWPARDDLWHDASTFLRATMRHPPWAATIVLEGAALVGFAWLHAQPPNLLVSLVVHWGPDRDALDRQIVLAGAWGRSHGCRRLLMYTPRNPRAWVRRYGFTHLGDLYRKALI